MIDVHNIQFFLTNYGYLAVFALVTMESAGVPLPGETALIAAAVYAGTQHTMNIWLIIAAAAGGAHEQQQCEQGAPPVRPDGFPQRVNDVAVQCDASTATWVDQAGSCGAPPRTWAPMASSAADPFDS